MAVPQSLDRILQLEDQHHVVKLDQLSVDRCARPYLRGTDTVLDVYQQRALVGRGRATSATGSPRRLGETRWRLRRLARIR